jgi:hypothetical protein
MKEFLEMNDSLSNTRTSNKYRELLSIVIDIKSPQIQFITEIDKQGDMLFNINLEDIGLTKEIVAKYNKEIFSNLFADFVGELLIRENINDFATKIKKLKFIDYQEALSNKGHSKFGMKIEKDFMVFKFHIALLQNILTEDFKNIV